MDEQASGGWEASKAQHVPLLHPSHILGLAIIVDMWLTSFVDFLLGLTFSEQFGKEEGMNYLKMISFKQELLQTLRTIETYFENSPFKYTFCV